MQARDSKFIIFGYIPQIFLFIVNLNYIKDEIRHIKNGLLNYMMQSVWNTLNILAYFAIFCGTLVRMVTVKEVAFCRITIASASVLMTAKLLYYFRAFESTGRLISYLVKVGFLSCYAM